MQPLVDAMKSNNVEQPCLHLVMSSSENAFSECLECSGNGDSLVLIGTAVTLLAHPAMSGSFVQDLRIYASSADVQSHGLGQLVSQFGITLVDDREWVELVRQHHHCLSWK